MSFRSVYFIVLIFCSICLQHINSKFVTSWMSKRQSSLYLIDSAGNKVCCRVLKNNQRRETERLLGLGWYDFCKSLHLKIGDVVSFWILGNPMELHVRVDHLRDM